MSKSLQTQSTVPNKKPLHLSMMLKLELLQYVLHGQSLLNFLLFLILVNRYVILIQELKHVIKGLLNKCLCMLDIVNGFNEVNYVSIWVSICICFSVNFRKCCLGCDAKTVFLNFLISWLKIGDLQDYI